MAVIIRDDHLEKMIEREKQRRGDGSMAKTLGDIAREYLTRLEIEGVYNQPPADERAVASR